MCGRWDAPANDADEQYGTPCIVCGAPIVNGYGHDAGCTVRFAPMICPMRHRHGGSYGAKSCEQCGWYAEVVRP